MFAQHRIKTEAEIQMLCFGNMFFGDEIYDTSKLVIIYAHSYISRTNVDVRTMLFFSWYFSLFGMFHYSHSFISFLKDKLPSYTNITLPKLASHSTIITLPHTN